MTDDKLLNRITINPDVMVGKPIIRGTRIPVVTILRMLGQSISRDEILREYPRLERADIDAALAYAAAVVEDEDVFPVSVPDEPVAA